MRITFVVPLAGLFGGIRVVAIYAELLRRRGHELCVVSACCRDQSLRRRLRALLKPSARPRTPMESISYFQGLSIDHRVISKPRPVRDADVPDADVVIATWWRTAEWVAGLSAAKGAKAYFVQDYGAHPGQPLDAVARTWHLPMHKLTISRWLMDLIDQHSGDRDVTYVPNSVDTEMFNAPPRGKQSRPTFGLMYSTRPQKGVNTIVDALSAARAAIPELHIVAYGPGAPTHELPLPAGAEYYRMASDDQLREIYGRCDAWLYGSRLEGFGLPILEAMACRTPVIGAATGAAPELIGEGGGILVSPDDVRGMTEAILRIARMSDVQWRAMSDRAYATATQYSWDDATDRFESGLLEAVRLSRPHVGTT